MSTQTASTTIPDNMTSAFSTWQQTLVEQVRSKTKPTPAAMIAEQQKFVTAAAISTDELAAYLSQQIGLANAQHLTNTVPKLQPVTADEMLNTPFEWEHHVGKQLKTVDRIAAADSVWWYICHIKWLQDGVFPNPPHETFKARVNNKTLTTPPASMPHAMSKKLDEATRNLTRRLGGLPYIRRQYRVATDPPIARAYWRYKLAEAAANADPAAKLTTRTVHETLHRGSWSWFIDRTQASYSSVLEPRAVAAVCAIAQQNKKGIHADYIKTVAQRSLYAHPRLTDWATLTTPTTPPPNGVDAPQPDNNQQTNSQRNEQNRRRNKRRKQHR